MNWNSLEVVFFTVWLLPSFGLRADEPIPVDSRVFNIAYDINEAALPLVSVALWYTADGGSSWHHYGTDEDRRSPMSFSAPSEGLLGFYFVMTNSVGVSSASPVLGTKPHLTAFVDFTPPVVQLHPLRQTTVLGQRVLQMRWAAIDAHLPTRAIEIEYRHPAEEHWRLVSSEPIGNSGRHDWRLPESLLGQIEVRVRVRDLGGNISTSKTQRTDLIDRIPATADATADAPPSAAEDVAGGRLTGASRTRAYELYRKGQALAAAGQTRAAIGSMREAIRLDPGLTDAIAAMADMLYRMKDLDRSRAAYELVLKQAPRHRGALRGIAMVLRQQDNYGGAAMHLRALLQINPNDAEVWMNLGDVAIFQGDEITARESYRRAIESDPEATEIVSDARKRLELMSQVSRSYH